MKKVLILLVVLLMLGMYGSGSVEAKVMTIHKCRFLLDSKSISVIENAEYLDEILEIRVTKAEGKYIIALTILDPKIIVYYGDSKVKNIIEGNTSKPLMNEVTLENLQNYQIYVYNKKGFLVLKPIKGIRFGELNNVQEYSTIDMARQALEK